MIRASCYLWYHVVIWIFSLFAIILNLFYENLKWVWYWKLSNLSSYSTWEILFAVFQMVNFARNLLHRQTKVIVTMIFKRTVTFPIQQNSRLLSGTKMIASFAQNRKFLLSYSPYHLQCYFTSQTDLKFLLFQIIIACILHTTRKSPIHPNLGELRNELMMFS